MKNDASFRMNNVIILFLYGKKSDEDNDHWYFDLIHTAVLLTKYLKEDIKCK